MTDTVAFRRGDRGPAVAEIRARLARLELLPGSQYAAEHAHDDPLRFTSKASHDDPSQWQTTALLSAEYDADVERAVREFQRERGITVDGAVGAETFKRLEEARWRLGDRVLSYSAAHPASGDDVLSLQTRLNAMGFRCGREDAYLGPLTDSGLREFQRNTGLSVDGVCGAATFRALAQLRRTVGDKSANDIHEKYALAVLQTGIRGKSIVLDVPLRGQEVLAQPDQDLVTALARKVEGKLVALGARVIRTKAGLRTPTDRARWANELGADIVLSLTACRDDEMPAGIAAYYYGVRQGNHSVPGKLAATLIGEQVGDAGLTGGRDPERRTWDILRLTRMPAVRLECGNLAHSDDVQRLKDPHRVDSLAQCLGDAVELFFAPDHVH